MLAEAREFMEREYERARAVHRQREARAIAERICCVIEMQEFAEAHALSSPLTVVSDDP